MAVSFVNSAGANATTITIPTGFAAADIILIFAYSSTVTAPALPAGYTNIFVQTTNSGLRLGYKIAAGGDTSGTWTGADYLICGVYRGASGIGGANSISNVTSTTTTISGVATFTNATGTSWVVSAAGSNQGTSMTTPAGTTLRTSQTNGAVDMGLLLDSNAGVTAYGQKLSTNGVTAVSGGGSVELVATVTGAISRNLMLLGVGS